jgi:hypothetical protein
VIDVTAAHGSPFTYRASSQPVSTPVIEPGVARSCHFSKGYP